MIETWKLEDSTGVIAQVQTFVQNESRHKAIHKTLSGELHIQTIGDPLYFAQVKLLCTREEYPRVNKAESDGSVLSLVYRGKTYIGYINGRPSWESIIAGHWYTTEIEFLIETVI